MNNIQLVEKIKTIKTIKTMKTMKTIKKIKFKIVDSMPYNEKGIPYC